MATKIIHSEYEIDVDDLIPKDLINNHPKFNRFLNIARSTAISSQYDRYRLGAVITLKGKVIARGFNAAKSHPTQKKFNRNREDFEDVPNHFLHAEISALNKLKGVDLSKAEMFVYHVGPSNNQKMARPCAGCMEAIKSSGIKKIHYSTPDGFAQEYLNKPVKVKRSKKII